MRWTGHKVTVDKTGPLVSGVNSQQGGNNVHQKQKWNSGVGKGVDKMANGCHIFPCSLPTTPRN